MLIRNGNVRFSATRRPLGRACLYSLPFSTDAELLSIPNTCPGRPNYRLAFPSDGDIMRVKARACPPPPRAWILLSRSWGE